MDAIRRHVEQAVDAVARRAGLHVRRLSRQPEHNLLGLRDQPIQTVMDVGANAGQFARKARQIFPDARLFCFEPLSTPFTCLKAWAQQQHGRVTCIQSAVGAESGRVAITEHLDHSPSSSVMASTAHQLRTFPASTRQKTYTVPLTSLDNYFPQQGSLALPVLLKIDVQGYEMEVLKGAPLFLRHCNYILIEISFQSLYEGQPDFSRVANFLYNAGFTFTGLVSQILDLNNRPIYADALFSKTIMESQ